MDKGPLTLQQISLPVTCLCSTFDHFGVVRISKAQSCDLSHANRPMRLGPLSCDIRTLGSAVDTGALHEPDLHAKMADVSHYSHEIIDERI
ncbi:hypothetical protein SAMN06309944_2101 [Micrococcales bacterium KH10]|nr:hypothetical protein SAMN06309944_2101 [Micrococcales bacterium KH10]